ncbi:MAG: Transposase IS200 like protein [Syntrophorhabdus sp. PtaU1.Bin153]|nr:MAG: Transposase IS200 like protein [Syntrophorhabdus sp. PtaU1.Bin153]
MPRKARIDAAGALHHIIVRGIERGVIFRDRTDRDRFVQRLSGILTETATQCFAWTLIPNHLHLLLKTGTTPIGRVMQKLLTGYAVSYNRRYARSGHLFQNRYKSILCQEEPYLLELVRYIHLNPIRAGIAADMDALDRFAYCGHGVLIGRRQNDWQNTDEVLGRFAPDLDTARTGYREFVAKGLSMGHRSDLTGGGLIRSSGGWQQVIEKRRDKAFRKSDERVLGDHEFVSQVLAGAKEQMGWKYSLNVQGIDLAAVISRVCEVLHCDRYDIFTPGKVKNRVHARSLFCYWAVRELGTSQAELSCQLKLSPAAITQSVKRGEEMAKESGYSLVSLRIKGKG